MSGPEAAFVRLEAEGQRLPTEQLKTMLKALAWSSTLRGDARWGLVGES